MINTEISIGSTDKQKTNTASAWANASSIACVFLATTAALIRFVASSAMPVPAPDQQTVEASRMRKWDTATIILKNS